MLAVRMFAAPVDSFLGPKISQQGSFPPQIFLHLNMGGFDLADNSPKNG